MSRCYAEAERPLHLCLRSRFDHISDTSAKCDHVSVHLSDRCSTNLDDLKKITEKYQTLYLIYLTSMSIYGVFLGYSNIASRMSGVMRFVELFLLIYAIRTMKYRNRLIVAGFFVLLESLMLVKNINSYIVQGDYDDAVTIATYSYVSIFNENRIYKIRHIESKYLAE